MFDLIVLSPHRDDAAFSLGLAVERWLAEGHTVSVLNCFTQSAYAPYSDAEALHPNDRTSFVSALRRREDEAWNKLLQHRLRFTDLDLLDAPLRLVCTPDEVLTMEIRAGDRALSRVEGAIAKLAKRLQTSKVRFVAPLAVGGHIDHRIVHRAAVQALGAGSPELAFYEDLPYSAWDGQADRLASIANEISPILVAGFGSVGEVETSVRRKANFAECYDSQIDSNVVHTIAEFARRYSGRERLWAGESWLRSGLLEPAGQAE